MGFELMATDGTARRLKEAGIRVTHVNKLQEGHPNLLDHLIDGRIQLIMNTPSGKGARTDEGRIRSAAVAHGVCGQRRFGDLQLQPVRRHAVAGQSLFDVGRPPCGLVLRWSSGNQAKQNKQAEEQRGRMDFPCWFQYRFHTTPHRSTCASVLLRMKNHSTAFSYGA